MGEVSAAVACTSECFQLTHLASLVSRWWRNRVPVQETRSDPWVGQIPLKKAMAAHSGISCLENPMDRGAWWGTVQGVARVRHSWVSEQQQRLTPDGFFHILPEVWGWSVEVESWLASEDKNTGVLAMAHCWLLFVRCHSWPLATPGSDVSAQTSMGGICTALAVGISGTSARWLSACCCWLSCCSWGCAELASTTGGFASTGTFHLLQAPPRGSWRWAASTYLFHLKTGRTVKRKQKQQQQKWSRVSLL